MSTAAERKAAERVRKRKDGLRPYEVWVRPEDWPKVQKYLKRYALPQDAKL